MELKELLSKATTAEQLLRIVAAVRDRVTELPKEEQEKYIAEDSAQDKELKDTAEGEVDKAEKDIAEKGGDSQTKEDRIDESVGEQEAEKGQEDTQTAKDRIDESEGEQKADEPDIKKMYEMIKEVYAALQEKQSKEGEEKDLKKPKPTEEDEEENNEFSAFFPD